MDAWRVFQPVGVFPMDQDVLKAIIKFYENPATRQGFLDFFYKAQQEGMAAARKLWETSAAGQGTAAAAPELFEQMAAFYSSLGFVPKQKFDAVVEENEELKKENDFLKKTLQEINFKVFQEGSSQVHEAWKDVVEKQMAVNKELAKGFLDLFNQSSDKE